ncbi:hypothetical protein [Nocardia sp. NPDC059239]|uniref:hypothetical protein n=1 Tax=Nocardia sp. NPDC059239 TaxID=3346785 RepID=UPI00369034C5
MNHNPVLVAADPRALREVTTAIDSYTDRQRLAIVDPEHRLIEPLLNAATEHAAAILEVVRVEEFSNYLPRVVYTAIAEVVRAGHQPTPTRVAEYAHGTAAPATDPLPSHTDIVRYLATVYTSQVKERLWSAAALVLESSYRRKLADNAIRITQMAQAQAPVHQLENHATTADSRRQIHKARADIAAAA